MKRGMTIEFLMCRAGLNFEVDFASGILLYLDNASFSSIIYKKKNAAFLFKTELPEKKDTIFYLYVT